MKTLFHSLLAFGLLATGALAQLGEGADSFSLATVVPPEGGGINVDLREYTLQVNEPLASEYVKPHTAWWRWVAPEDGFCVVDTLSRGWTYTNPTTDGTIIAIYTGGSLINLNRVGLSSPYKFYSEGDGYAAAVRFYAQKGLTYYIQLGSYAVSPTAHYTRLSVRPLAFQPLRKISSWTYTNTEGKNDFGGFNVLVNPSGAVSGKLQLSTGAYPFAGVLDRAGNLKVSVLPKPRKGASPPEPITLFLQGSYDSNAGLEMPGDGYRIVDVYEVLPIGSIPEGSWSGTFQYLSPSNVNGPVSMKVKPNKTVSIAARGPDGVAMTLNAPILKSGGIIGGLSLLKFLNGGKSGLVASLRFSEGVTFALNNTGYYKRAENPASVLYPSGIFSGFNVYAYPYTKPAAGQRVMGFLNASAGVGRLRITDPTSELGGTVEYPVTLGTDNKFVFAADPVRKPMLKVNTATGQVTGSIILAGKKRTLMGSIYASSTARLTGYVTGTTKNLSFEVVP